MALPVYNVASEAIGQTFELKGLDVVKGSIEIEPNNAVFSSGAEHGATNVMRWILTLSVGAQQRT